MGGGRWGRRRGLGQWKVCNRKDDQGMSFDRQNQNSCFSERTGARFRTSATLGEKKGSDKDEVEQSTRAGDRVQSTRAGDRVQSTITAGDRVQSTRPGDRVESTRGGDRVQSTITAGDRVQSTRAED
ncbi:hypothetical protein RRG08_036171 [Elysia crispata]|uniref:Uncharacterized protein n=1 Tax=Elysia crispata TaxID=231223 RepID=A0AAE1CEL4_9GAST|nr:hypothetical protein RRG08_036171 [Elysia crispata]